MRHKRTYIGSDCKYGHGGVRSLASKKCVVCARNSYSVYRAKNPAKAKETYLKWLAKNIEKERISLKYQQNNLHRYAANAATRRANQKHRTPQWADSDRIASMYRLASEMSAQEGIVYHVDHIIPLAGRNVSGLHVHENLAVIPAIENMQKRNHFHVS